MIVLQCFR